MKDIMIENNSSGDIKEIKLNGASPPELADKQKYMNGPDQILPADDYITWLPHGHVKLRLGSRGIDAEPPISVPGLLSRTVARYPDGAALVSKKPDGAWHKITFRQYQDKVRTCAKAFLKLGLQRYHSVCILGFNSEEWYISDLAAIHAGGYAAGIYTTNSPEACYHCLHSSRANICVVQDKKQLVKILEVWPRLPNLKAIVQWEEPIDRSTKGIYSWQEMMEIGSKEPDQTLDDILKTISVNECCTLVYTSGTLGHPKAVMLSHDNLTWDAYAISERVRDVQAQDERIISFLPLSHVAAQVVDIYVTLSNGVPVYFAQPDALKGSLVETMKEIRPTRFLAVPRVWEKMHEKIVAVGASRGSLTRAIAGWAKGKGLEFHTNRINGALTADTRGLPTDFTTYEMFKYWYVSTDHYAHESSMLTIHLALGCEGMSCGYKIAQKLVFQKVRESLGLDQCTTFVTAAAPLSADIKKFFLSLDIPIMDAFGMSEASGAHSLSIDPKFRLDSVGELLEGTETKFFDAQSPHGPGEICMRGRHVFMGYLNDETKTKEAIDQEGWLHSGDIGRADSNDFLYITGRIKELIITAGGENVAPVLIEQTIKTAIPQVGYAVLIGDQRKFLSVLLTLKTKVNPDTGDALDELESETKKWVASLGSKCTTLSEIEKTKDAAVYKALEEGLAKANKLAISNAQKVQKFAVLPVDFSVNSGELGPTLKIKRSVVYEKYKNIIEDFYKE